MPPSRKLTAVTVEEVLRRMPAAVVVVEAASGRFLHANPRAREMAERLRGCLPPGLTSGWEIFHPDGRPYRMEEWPVVRSMTTGEEVVDEEYFNVLPDGGRLIVRCRSSPIYDVDGAIVAGVLLMEDVTQQKRAEDQLRYHGHLLENVEDAVVGTDPEFRLTTWNRGAERLYGYSAAEVLGRDAREIATYSGDTSRLALERELRERDRARVELTAHRKDGTPVEVELAAVAIRGERDEITGYLGIHRDVTERKRAGEERNRWARRQAAVAELGMRALASDDLRAVMDEAATVTAQMLEVELVGIAELLAGGDELLLRAGHGWREGAEGAATSRAHPGSLERRTLTSGAPVVSDDLVSDPRFTLSAPLHEAGGASGVSVAIAGGGGPFGVLGAFSTQRRSFSDHEVTFVQAVANVLGTAVQRAEAEQTLIGVKEAERQRIARDLHDEALRDLTEVIAQASSAPPGSGDADDRLARLIPALERVGSHLRSAVFDLRLGGEEDRPFPDLLRSLVASQRAIAAGAIHLDIGDGVPAGSLGRRGTEILRVVAEAVVNARRHAAAREIRVTASGSAQRLRVEVVDDGRGFDPATARGRGVTGMRERADLLDAHLDIASDSRSGTRVCLDLALPGEGGRPGRSVRVLLVEDHTAVRQAIATMLEREPDLHVAGQAASLAEARELLEGVDVAVIDLGLPDGDGADLVPELREASPRAQALVLSANLDRAQTARAIERGAAATLDKTAQLDELVDAVRRLRAGETLMPLDEVVEMLRFAARRRRQEQDDRHALERLTPREREILQALGEGLDTQSIADRLHITPRTTRNHVSSILAKLGVHSQLQAVLFALRYDLVQVA
jgi:PAS domain S-box-containing protein